MRDNLYSDQLYRARNILVEGVRAALDIVIDTSITAQRVFCTLVKISAEPGFLKAIRVVKGSEMT